MTPSLFRWVDKFAGLHVLVIGEAMLDTYLVGTPVVDLYALTNPQPPQR